MGLSDCLVYSTFSLIGCRCSEKFLSYEVITGTRTLCLLLWRLYINRQKRRKRQAVSRLCTVPLGCEIISLFNFLIVRVCSNRKCLTVVLKWRSHISLGFWCPLVYYQGCAVNRFRTEPLQEQSDTRTLLSRTSFSHRVLWPEKQCNTQRLIRHFQEIWRPFPSERVSYNN